MGLGCTILGHVDLVLMDEGARLRVPFAEMGVPPEAASSVLLPGPHGMAAGGRRRCWPRSGSTRRPAVAPGLALRACPDGTVLAETLELARTDRLVPGPTPPGRSSG